MTIFFQTLGDQASLSTRGNAIQSLHSNHRGHRLGPRNGKSRLANEARTQSSQRGNGENEVRHLIEQSYKKIEIKLFCFASTIFLWNLLVKTAKWANHTVVRVWVLYVRSRLYTMYTRKGTTFPLLFSFTHCKVAHPPL